MTVGEVPTPDRNKAIADASEKQHQTNVIRELYYRGINVEIPGRLAGLAFEQWLEHLRDADSKQTELPL